MVWLYLAWVYDSNSWLRFVTRNHDSSSWLIHKTTLFYPIIGKTTLFWQLLETIQIESWAKFKLNNCPARKSDWVKLSLA